MTTETTYKVADLVEMFETRKRDDGSEFVALKEGSPEWAHDFVRDAHGTEMLPDDYRYRWISEALDLIAGSDRDPDDLRDEFTDGVDFETHKLLAWLSSNLTRLGYCDDADNDGLAAVYGQGITSMIQAGQYSERLQIWDSTLTAIEAHGVIAPYDEA